MQNERAWRRRLDSRGQPGQWLFRPRTERARDGRLREGLAARPTGEMAVASYEPTAARSRLWHLCFAVGLRGAAGKHDIRLHSRPGTRDHSRNRLVKPEGAVIELGEWTDRRAHVECLGELCDRGSQRQVWLPGGIPS